MHRALTRSKIDIDSNFFSNPSERHSRLKIRRALEIATIILRVMAHHANDARNRARNFRIAAERINSSVQRIRDIVTVYNASDSHALHNVGVNDVCDCSRTLGVFETRTRRLKKNGGALATTVSNSVFCYMFGLTM